MDRASVAEFAAERKALQEILESDAFQRAPNLARFLAFVCEKYFAGEQASINEYSIGLDAFGRPAEFDPRKDSIVRVEARRLRQRLAEYYAKRSEPAEITVTLPVGSYVPLFLRRDVEDAPAVKPRPRWPVSFLGAVGLAVAAIVMLLWTTGGTPRVAEPEDRAATSDEINDGALRIRLGATEPYTDRLGRRWQPDQYFLGGESYAATPRPILSASDPQLYLSGRRGNASYAIPLADGVYEVRLHFAETELGEVNGKGGDGWRIFSINVNGTPYLSRFDIHADAGGGNTAEVKVLKDVRPQHEGKLNLFFYASGRGAPLVNAIEIVPGLRGRMRPLRVRPSVRAGRESSGLFWSADQYALGGTISETGNPGDLLPRRYGRFRYAIPVALGGHYAVRFSFQENLFGPENPVAAGPGSRVFDVFSGGETLLRDFDILKEAGGRKVIHRTFRNLTPNRRGKLEFDFSPQAHYALVSGVEVIDETALSPR